MSTDVTLNHLSDDSGMKEYIRSELMPRVFHDVPISTLNTGFFSLVSEYLSQTIEQQSFTNTFFFNEAFITNAVLPDSIYSHAAIFNLGYAFATPSCCNFLLELRIPDLLKNSTNIGNGIREFILDRDTKFNLSSNGSVYSLDYDILIRYKYQDDKNNPQLWNIQYTNVDSNAVSVNAKTPYILYRVTNDWLCLFVTASEYTRHSFSVVNNTTRGIPNADKVMTFKDHICGFDVWYVTADGTRTALDRDHILPIHSSVRDDKPYIHYIMDSCQTIRFIFQMEGSNYFVADPGSSFEFIVYTCHGVAANFTAFDNTMEQPNVITSSMRYPNNANIVKSAFVIGASMNGTDIGTADLVRRQTIEAYNTANVISSDHDIEEWFKTFAFQNVMYPFFFKRRDDPWGRIWSGFLALKDSDDYIFRTNTLTAQIPYEVLYQNNDNTVTKNEIIIPPGWIWRYGETSPKTNVIPIYREDNKQIEMADSKMNLNSEKYVFANPFGIRIQKDPFAIGYFNPWINETITTTKIGSDDMEIVSDDESYLYGATPLVTNVQRTFAENYYKFASYISPTYALWRDGTKLIPETSAGKPTPTFAVNTWNYFKRPVDLYAFENAILPLRKEEGFIPFDPEHTYFCAKEKVQNQDGTWTLSNCWIQDLSTEDAKLIYSPISGNVSLIGMDDVWGNMDVVEAVPYLGETDIHLYPTDHPHITFRRADEGANYYEMRIGAEEQIGAISKIVVDQVFDVKNMAIHSEPQMYRIGTPGADEVILNIYYNNGTEPSVVYRIRNAKAVYIPWSCTYDAIQNQYTFDLHNVGPEGIVLYADMKSVPSAPSSENIDYYRLAFSNLTLNQPAFYVRNTSMNISKNHMRVFLSAYVNGERSGYTEMIPTKKDADGTYLFEALLHPLNQLVDVDNMIHGASRDVGGGNWIPNTVNQFIGVDAEKPEFVISILVESTLQHYHNDEFDLDGYRTIDQFKLDSFSMIQELKEMRSVVKFGDYGGPSQEEMNLYTQYMDLNRVGESEYDYMEKLYPLTDYANAKCTQSQIPYSKDTIVTIASTVYGKLSAYNIAYNASTEIRPTEEQKAKLAQILAYVKLIRDDNVPSSSGVTWQMIYDVFLQYNTIVNDCFNNINSSILEIQLVPFVEYDLMNSERFKSFVSTFTNVHKAIEPVLMKRLEGNNHLDCKLIATYGIPHSYTSDMLLDVPNSYWPDLNVQIEFDIKLKNMALSTTTLQDLRTIVKTHFMRLTSVHTPVEDLNLDNNIYISTLIKQLEDHENVAYLKFKGWYTNEKENGNYMDANTQAIVMKKSSLEKFTPEEMQVFVPELFVLTDDNIVLNLL